MTKKKIGQLAGVLFLIVAGIFIGMNWQNWFGEPLEAQLTDVESAEDWTGERKAAQKPSPTIDIPQPGEQYLLLQDFFVARPRDETMGIQTISAWQSHLRAYIR